MRDSTCSKRQGVLQVFVIILLTAFLSVSAHALNPTQNGPAGKDGSAGRSSPDSTKLLQFKSGKHVTAFQPGKVYIASFDHVLSMEFVGAGNVEHRAIAASPERSGKGPGLLGRVEYRNQWEGITVRYDAVKGGIAESTYVVEPGADVKAIRLRYNVPAEKGPDGSLIFRISSKRGMLKETPPVAWQEIDGKKVPVKVAYAVRDGLVGFDVASYDTRHTLIIDPTYQWHTFYGQVQGDEGSALAVDGNGNVYVAGFSYNSLTPGTWTGPTGQAPIHAHSGGSDIMVMKLNSSGEYQWHTFYGDPDRQWANAIAVDASGNVYVTGFTDGGQWAGDGGAAPIRMGEYDGGQIIVLKLNTNGAYQWHTFYGQWVDEGLAIAVNGSGVFLTGYANGQPSGTWVDLPAALHAHSGSGYDLFVLKLSLAGAHLWHTFYGAATNNGYDEGRAIALDASGNIYVTGYSQLTWQGASAVNPLHDHSYPGTAGKPDIFVLKLNSSGGYLWHTFYGAAYTNPYWATGEFGNGIALDESGNVYVAGYSSATWGTPLHAYSGSQDITVLKLNSSGAYQWHTFYGSDSHNYGHAIAVRDDHVYVAGDGNGTWNGDGGKLPVHALNSSSGLTVLKLNTSGAYQWHTFYDSSAMNVSHGIGVDQDNGIYVSGSSTASWTGDGGTAPKHAYTAANDITVLKLEDDHCIYSISSPSRIFPANGGSVNVTIKATGPVACEVPVITPSAGWITAALTTAGWNRNKGVVKITVAKSTTSLQKSGNVAIADKTYLITQKPVLCNITKLLPPSHIAAAAGETSFFDITLTAGDCAWTASSDKEWITPDASGTGSGRVDYTVGANETGKRRTGKITVLLSNGKKKPHTVNQLK